MFRSPMRRPPGRERAALAAALLPVVFLAALLPVTRPAQAQTEDVDPYFLPDPTFEAIRLPRLLPRPTEQAGQAQAQARRKALSVEREARKPRAGEAPAPATPAVAASGPGALPPSVRRTLERLGFSQEGLSVFVQAVDEDEPLIDHRTDVPRNPASVMKLVTTLAGLDLLGPGFKWYTEGYAAGPVENGRLRGPLYLRGSGDPLLTSERLWRGLRELRSSGLRHIDGGLVLDEGHFAPAGDDPGDFDRRPYRAYNVQPSALLINFGATTFRFLPDGKRGVVRIATEPPNSRLDVRNDLKLVKGRCRGRHRNIVMSVKTRSHAPRVRFSGEYPERCGSFSMLRSVAPDHRYVLGVFEALWSEMGGTVADEVAIGTVPEGAERVMRIASEPLSDAVRGMNKYSNNVMTRQLLLTLGAESEGPPGTLAKGRVAIERWMRGLGVDPAGLVVDNGAGLSRDARVTARQMGKLLLTAYHSPLMPEFIASMPLSAVEGTLRRRFNESPLAGRIYMKTGLIKHVRAAAGFLWAEDGTVYALVSLHNGPGVHNGGGTEVQDELLEWLYSRRG